MTAFIVDHPVIFVILLVSLTTVVLHYITKNSSRSRELDIREKNIEKRAATVSQMEKDVANAQSIIDEAKKREQSLQLRESTLNNREQELQRRETRAKERDRDFNEAVRRKVAATVLNISNREYLSSTRVFSVMRKCPDDFRLVSALAQDLRILPPLEMSARIFSGNSGKTYAVSLNSCECEDFKRNHRPCKHMYRLATELGAILAYDTKRQQEKILALDKQTEERAKAQKKSDRQTSKKAKK